MHCNKHVCTELQCQPSRAQPGCLSAALCVARDQNPPGLKWRYRYLSSTGHTGWPAEKAPRRNLSRQGCALVVASGAMASRGNLRGVQWGVGGQGIGGGGGWRARRASDATFKHLPAPAQKDSSNPAIPSIVPTCDPPRAQQWPAPRRRAARACCCGRCCRGAPQRRAAQEGSAGRSQARKAIRREQCAGCCCPCCRGAAQGAAAAGWGAVRRVRQLGRAA